MHWLLALLIGPSDTILQKSLGLTTTKKLQCILNGYLQ